MDTVKRLFDLLTPEEQRKLYLLFVAIVIMAGLEVVSVASIAPFLSVASDPASIHEKVYLKWAFDAFGFTDRHAFLITLGVTALIALVVSNTFIVAVTWLQYQYVWNQNHIISKRLLRGYLQRPYEFFLTRNTSDLSKNILEEARMVSVQMLLPAIRATAKGIVSVSIVAFLIFVDPTVALIVAVVLGGAYGSIWLSVHKKLDEIGEKRVIANEKRFQAVSESLGAIKAVKLRSKEAAFVSEFDIPSRRYAHYRTVNQLINKAPRYILEAIAFGGIILIAVYLIAVRGDIEQVVPILGLYAFAGYRLMPALQSTFRGFAKAQFNIASLETLHRDMYEGDSGKHGGGAGGSKDRKDPIGLENNIIMKNVTFTYPGAEKPAIEDLSLKIPARTTVGIVGKTGSGKTTAVDLMLGLLRPNKGEIRVDGIPLQEESLSLWQRSVGYVPQDIYLADDTIEQNVAFGIPNDQIDSSQVTDALRRAQVFEFVSRDLPKGLQTNVGERGVKLSGGQRQRIGIARALYHRPSVIFFDEATSALDQATEQAVMEAVYSLGGNRTIILISHRMSTVRSADKIFVLKQGELVGRGAYDDLVTRNSSFQSIAASERH
ncbi:ATP-binding cassette subfamily C protein [Salinibacter ruber]|uniref:ATP-binding cassette subfamily C protein n=1 Tax=Salinibacter ruber TaxID=146919 RepID=A0A9X2U209_9BACT|nr:ATP-binding cassette subfamily C protein [Salinibacter ruber]MCS3864617.1 ATP-binding cassette subfamily C protein [Salinibacter ruber]